MTTRPHRRRASDPTGLHLTRRGALALGGLGLAAAGGVGLGVRALGGDGPIGAIGEPADPARPTGRPACVDAGDLPIQKTLGGAPLIYDISGDPSDFHVDTAFHDQLEAWLPKHVAESGLGAPAQVWTFGTWIDGTQSASDSSGRTATPAAGESTCTSWHNAGRALDLSRLVAGDGTVLVSCRYDLWSRLPDEQMVPIRTAYWRTAAGLHRDFDSVLTYLFDDLHHNHIHIDNGHIHIDNGLLDGRGSEFRTRSAVQVQAVQAMCTYVWGRPVDLSGDWDRATRAATQQVLAEMGVGGRLTDGTTAWQGFLTATLRRA
ncbi:MAG: hypothetical protein ABI083_18110 [Lapillicoccus sp.]